MSREEQLLFIGMEYEKKLKELMGEEEFAKFSVDVARRGFLKEIVGMADGDYKDFCIKNFARVVGLKDDEIPKAEKPPKSSYDVCYYDGKTSVENDCSCCPHSFECSGSGEDDE